MTALLVDSKTESFNNGLGISVDVEKRMSYFAPDADVCHFFSRRAAGVEALAFTNDSAWLAVGRSDGQIDIYDVEGDYLVMSLPGGEDKFVRCLRFLKKIEKSSKESFSLFEYRLISSGLHGVITEWDLRSQSVRFQVPSFGGAVFSLDISPNGDFLVTAGDDGGARLFKLQNVIVNSTTESLTIKDSDTEEQIEEQLTFWKLLTKNDGRLLSVCIYNNQHIFAGTATSHIIRWNIITGYADGKLTLEKNITSATSKGLNNNNSRGTAVSLRPSQTIIWALSPLPTYGLLASGDSTGSVCFWDVNTGTLVKLLKPHQLDVLSLAACPTGTSLFSVGLDGKLSIFVPILPTENERNGIEEWILSGSRHPHESDIRAVAVSGEGHVATGSSDTQVTILTQLQSCSPEKITLPSTSASISSSWISVSDSMRLILTIHSHYIEVWHLMESLSFDNDSKFSGGTNDGLIPIKTAKIELDDNGGAWEGIRCAAISPNGNIIAVSNNCGTRLFKFDLTELSLETAGFKKLSQQICSAMTFITYGDKLCLITASVSTRNSSGELKHRLKVTIWDLETQTSIAEIKNIQAAIQKIVVSPDSQWIAFKSIIGKVTIYSLDKMQQLTQLPPFPVETTMHHGIATLKSPSSEMAGAITFSPDSKYLTAFCVKPKCFMMYSMESQRLLVANDVAPRSSLRTLEEGIFRVQHLNPLQGDDVGNITWVTELESRQTNGKDESITNMHTILVQTRHCLASIRFQIFESGSNSRILLDGDDPSSSMYIEKNGSKDNAEDHQKKRLRSKETLLTGGQSRRSKKVKNTSTKIHKMRNHLELLYGTILQPSTQKKNGANKLKPTVLAFTQSKDIPLNQLPDTIQKKRYAT